MKTPFRYLVRFQIRHPTARADDLVAGLPWAASTSWTVGEERVTPAGNRLAGARSQSYCSFDIAQGDDGELAACLSRTIEALSSHADHLADVCFTGGKLDFYVFWYPNGDTGQVFTPDLLQRMASLNIALGINVYDDRPGRG